MPDLDIPEVQEQIEQTTPLVHRHWGRQARAAIKDALDELDGIDPAGLTRTEKLAIIAAILLLMRRRIDAPPPRRERLQVIDSARQLVQRGAAVVTEALNEPELAPERFTRLALAQTDALYAESRWRFRSVSRHQSVTAILFEWLEQPTARRTPEERQAETESTTGADVGAPATEAATTAPTEARSVPDRIDGKPGSVDAAAWRRALNNAVLDAMAATDSLVDTWAYGARSVGIFEAARELGVTELVAVNNPPTGPDERTTKFCFWVHGRTINLRGSWVKRLREYRAAVAADDAEAARKARPMGSFAKTDGPQRFREHFASVGLPPYHFRCRTQCRPKDEST